MLKSLLPLAIALPILLTACGGSSSPSNPESTDNRSPIAEDTTGKNLSMNLDLAKLQSVGISADKIIVTITKGDFTRTIEATHTDYAASVAFSGLVIGDYAISVQIFDADIVVAEGVGVGSVTASQVATVDIELELKSGGLVVNVNVSDPSESEFLFVTKTMTTITGKLEGGPIVASGLIGSIMADGYEHATYDHEAAYTQLETGSEIEMGFGISFNSIDANVLEIVSEGVNTLEIKYNNLTMISCTECDSDIQMAADTLTVSYKNIDLPGEIANSLVDLNTGNALEVISPGILTQRLNIKVSFQRIDGNNIPVEDINSARLLDESEYQIQLDLKGEDCLSATALSGCISLGTVSAN
jgi:hypothetical protein